MLRIFFVFICQQKQTWGISNDAKSSEKFAKSVLTSFDSVRRSLLFFEKNGEITKVI